MAPSLRYPPHEQFFSNSRDLPPYMRPGAEGGVGEKLVSLAAQCEAAAYLEQTHDVSERRAFRILALYRSTKRQQPGQRDQTEVSSVFMRSLSGIPALGTARSISY